MNTTDLRLRTASITDAEELLRIYAPYITDTAITFEWDIPTLADFQQRMRNTLERYPYIVAECGGEILGYAYTGPLGVRAAYAWAAETTIYLKNDSRGRGLGRRLYRALEDISRSQHILSLNACIAYPQAEDAYLTKNSMQFHQHLGFTLIGEFHDCGYKFGTWYNMIWMEKMIGPHTSAPLPVIPFSALNSKVLLDLGVR